MPELRPRRMRPRLFLWRSNSKEVIMSKAVRYIVAVVAIIVLYFIVFGVIGSLMGWQRGGGVLVIMGYIAASAFLWRRITRTNNKSNPSDFPTVTTDEKAE